MHLTNLRSTVLNCGKSGKIAVPPTNLRCTELSCSKSDHITVYNVFSILLMFIVNIGIVSSITLIGIQQKPDTNITTKLIFATRVGGVFIQLKRFKHAYNPEQVC